jgi:tyrosine-protein kinase Etk/Wzc
MGATHFKDLQLMNSTLTSHSTLAPAGTSGRPEDDEVDIGHYLDILLANKWLIAAITALALVIGVAYALLTRPVYEANLLIQVEDAENTSKSFLGEAGALFDVKAPASAEMEILRSRMVLGGAVEATKLYIDAHPRYVPLIGGWMARHASQLSNPGFLGMGGYVSGTEKIVIDRFEVPPALEPSSYVLTAKGNGEYTLQRKGWSTPLAGKVGTPLKTGTPNGTVLSPAPRLPSGVRRITVTKRS